MDDIKWADPPAVSDVRGRHGVMKRFVEALKSRPGEWAQYQPERGHSTATAGNIRRGYPGVEVTYRSRPDGLTDVYVRWVGNSNGDGHG